MAIIETKPGAYKGVEFLVITSSITGGRKDVLFEFPNSNKQTVEDLGLRPRSYDMQVIIPHENYITIRDSLLRALEDGEKGPLDHPFYGRVENVVARTFVIEESLTDLGRAKLQIVFAISDDIGIPQKALNAISEAAVQNAVLADAVTADIAESFEVTEGFLGNFQDAQELLAGVADTFNEVTSFASAITTEINQYAANVNAFTTKINQLIAVPQDLANSIKNIFSSVDTLFASVEATYDAFSNNAFFDFGANDSDIYQTTQGRVERSTNRDIVNQAMQVSSLGYAYLNAAQIDFLTETDVDAVSSFLDDQYALIFTLQSVAVPGVASPINPTQGLSDQTLTALTDLRTIANNLLDDKRTKAQKIITVNTKQMPMSVLAYRYYGSTELADTLLELNAIKGASFISGEISILTE
jgi:prophage DNA circulation protein